MMSQNNNSNLYQLQDYLDQISNYIYKINETILQMNAIINQMNCPMMGQINNLGNNQMNQMGNFINNNNDLNFNFNFSQGLKERESIISNKRVTNIVFRQYNGNFTNIIIDEEKKVEELFNIFFKRIGRPELINNYEGKFYFEEGSLGLLEKYKNNKIKEILKNGMSIFAKEINEMGIEIGSKNK